MRTDLLFLSLLIFFSPASARAQWEVRVVSVYDGDTLIVSDEGRAEIIRLFGIECPEKGQNFGLKAKSFTEAVAAGKKIRIIPVNLARNMTCKVYVGNRCLNKELLKAGYAWHDKRYSSDDEWARLEKNARSAEKGLWSQQRPLPPWKFRGTENKSTIETSHTIKLPSKHRTGTVSVGRHPPRRRHNRRRW